jgi:hypothetical protein
VTAANTFGPLLRFAFGAKFTAPHISAHLAKTAPPMRNLSARSHNESSVQERDASDLVVK